MFESETTTTAQSGFTATGASASSPAPETTYPFRLLADETVLGTYPIAKKRRPLGSLVSYLFVTDSRVIYSAEAKTFSSSSTHSKEFQMPIIHGIEVGRRRGLDALGVTASIGIVFNFLGMLILAGLAGAMTRYSGGPSFALVPNFDGIGGFFVFVAVASLIIGAVVIMILRRPTANLKIVGPPEPQPLARDTDLLKLIITILLFLIFGPFLGLTVVIWTIIRELGVFTANDAQLYANPDNIDHIAYEVGALILDVQARGKFASRA